MRSVLSLVPPPVCCVLCAVCCVLDCSLASLPCCSLLRSLKGRVSNRIHCSVLLREVCTAPFYLESGRSSRVSRRADELSFLSIIVRDKKAESKRRACDSTTDKRHFKPVA